MNTIRIGEDGVFVDGERREPGWRKGWLFENVYGWEWMGPFRWNGKVGSVPIWRASPESGETLPRRRFAATAGIAVALILAGVEAHCRSNDGGTIAPFLLLNEGVAWKEHQAHRSWGFAERSSEIGIRFGKASYIVHGLKIGPEGYPNAGRWSLPNTRSVMPCVDTERDWTGWWFFFWLMGGVVALLVLPKAILKVWGLVDSKRNGPRNQNDGNEPRKKSAAHS